MISSFTSKVRNLLFNEERPVPAQDFTRKRKRCDEERDIDDEDVIITAVKRPRTESGLFHKVVSNPYSIMTEWMKNKRQKWSDISFFRKYDNNADRWLPRPNPRGLEQPPSNGRYGNNRATNGPRSRPTIQQQVQKNTEKLSVPTQTVPTQTDMPVTHVNGANGVNGDAESVASGTSTNMSGQPRKIFTAKECVRLDEMEKYRMLLQQFTSVPVQSNQDRLNRSNNISWTDETILGGNLSRNYSRNSYIQRNKKQTNFTHSVSNLSYSVVPKRHISPLEVMKSAVDVKASVKHKQTIKSETVDKERDKSETRKQLCKFRDSPYLSTDWMEDLVTKYSVESRERNRKIAEEEVKTKVYEEQRMVREENLEKQIRHRMKILSTEPAIVEEPLIEIEEEEEKFPELTEEMLDKVSLALRPGHGDQILVEGYRLQITRKDMATLAGLNWLNDEIINFYMNMLMERGETEGNAKVYAFNTFFYPKILSGGHSAVRRWTRRVDVFAMDYIVIPVHLGMHWCLCVVDFKKKVVQYFDSMGGRNMECLNAVKNYIREESLDKKKKEFDMTGWELEIAEGIPQQMNGSDCGMFACKYAEYITRGADITFTQQDMPYFRKRMVYEILTKKLLQ